MADTDRSIAELLAIFADGQAAQSISEQDMRDFIVSLTPPHGSLGMQSNATATVISVAGTYVKVAGTTALNSHVHDFDAAVANNRLRILSLTTYHIQLVASLSFTVATNNQICGFKFWHWDDSASSGSYIEPSKIRRKVGTGSDVGALAIHGDALMDVNDYIELHGTNESGANDITVEELYLGGVGVLV